MNVYFNNALVVPQQPQVSEGTGKKLTWNPQVKVPTRSPILSQICRTINQRNQLEYRTDLEDLAQKLSALDKRMGAAVIEIVLEYHCANPDIVKVMGSQNAPPYGGSYIPRDLATSFELTVLPDPLVIILGEFVELVRTHSQKL